MSAASSVDVVLRGRVGMSPVMVGRARPYARLAGIVDADVLAEMNEHVREALIEALAPEQVGRLPREEVRERAPRVAGRRRVDPLVPQGGEVGVVLDEDLHIKLPARARILQAVAAAVEIIGVADGADDLRHAICPLSRPRRQHVPPTSEKERGAVAPLDACGKVRPRRGRCGYRPVAPCHSRPTPGRPRRRFPPGNHRCWP